MSCGSQFLESILQIRKPLIDLVYLFFEGGDSLRALLDLRSRRAVRGKRIVSKLRLLLPSGEPLE
jgi:hypothetical protein